MEFTSFNFMIFFPSVLLLYWLTPKKYRWITLLLVSYFFYINVKPVLALILASITLATYSFARVMDNTQFESKKKRYMIISIVFILMPLFFFKYFSSINSWIIELMQSHNLRWPLPEIKLILPVGISFYTFMAIGYVIDVYNEDLKAEKNPGIVALFISFFPLVLSGPIERAKNMLPQFINPKPPIWEDIIIGLKMMLWGYFMKLVIADRLGIYVDTVYENILHYNGTTFLLATISYPLQVYTDLGGYSLIAIGTAQTLGFNVMQNFRRPFTATSVAEFWRRWHISLIKWLTDYIYTPLSFSLRKYKVWGIIMALMLTFMISGIWHGAAMTFVVWGLLQGAFLSIEALSSKKKAEIEKKYNLSRKSWYTALCIVFTFVLFAISLVFSRSADLKEACNIFLRIFTNQGSFFLIPPKFAIIGISLVLFKDFANEFIPNQFQQIKKNSIIRYFFYWLLFYSILFFGIRSGGSSFIYFQF